MHAEKVVPSLKSDGTCESRSCGRRNRGAARLLRLGVRTSTAPSPRMRGCDHDNIPVIRLQYRAGEVLGMQLRSLSSRLRRWAWPNEVVPQEAGEACSKSPVNVHGRGDRRVAGNGP